MSQASSGGSPDGAPAAPDGARTPPGHTPARLTCAAAPASPLSRAWPLSFSPSSTCSRGGGGVGVGQASGSRLTRSQGHGPCIGPRPGGSSPLHLPLSASTVPAPPALCSSLRILPAWGWPGRPWPFASAAVSLLSAGNALPRLAPRQHPPVQVRTTRPCFRTCRMERPRGGGRRARPTGPGSERMRLPWS